jgi:uncharacterized membrane protein
MRFKNYGLWVALGALVALLLNDIFGIAPEVTNQYVDLILAVLVAAGIVINPKDGKGYRDKSKLDEKQVRKQNERKREAAK